jgi:hypothetical protein
VDNSKKREGEKGVYSIVKFCRVGGEKYVMLRRNTKEEVNGGKKKPQ